MFTFISDWLQSWRIICWALVYRRKKDFNNVARLHWILRSISWQFSIVDIDSLNRIPMASNWHGSLSTMDIRWHRYRSFLVHEIIFSCVCFPCDSWSIFERCEEVLSILVCTGYVSFEKQNGCLNVLPAGVTYPYPIRFSSLIASQYWRCWWHL